MKFKFTVILPRSYHHAEVTKILYFMICVAKICGKIQLFDFENISVPLLLLFSQILAIFGM